MNPRGISMIRASDCFKPGMDENEPLLPKVVIAEPAAPKAHTTIVSNAVAEPPRNNGLSCWEEAGQFIKEANFHVKLSLMIFALYLIVLIGFFIRHGIMS